MMIMFLLLRPVLNVWLRWRFRLVIHRHGAAARLRPPFLVLANHVNFWDPFLLVLPFDREVHFLSADGNFRSRVMRWLMEGVGAVPKAKARTDMESLHRLRHHAAERGIVALFPEGQRTWDGHSRGMLPATPKLARLLRVPVVMVHLRGAYLSTPRWATSLRRGRLEMHVWQVLSRHEVRSLPLGEITRRIADALEFDEGRWQERTGVRFVARNRAEHMERAFFRCPECGGWDTIRSRGDEVRCTACTFRAWFAPSGRLYSRSARSTTGASAALPPVFRSHQWNRWQLETLRQSLEAGGNGALPYRVPAVYYLTGYRSRPLRPRGMVELALTSTHLTLGGDGIDVRIPVADLRGVNVQYAAQLEFYTDGRLHVLRMQRPQDSAYRIEVTIGMLQELYKPTKH